MFTHVYLSALVLTRHESRAQQLSQCVRFRTRNAHHPDVRNSLHVAFSDSALATEQASLRLSGMTVMMAAANVQEIHMAEYATGKICYIEIPAINIAQSARFYETCFRWEMRTRGDGAVAFDDTVHQVSGIFVTGRAPAHEPGLVVHIMVADIRAIIAAIEASGGTIVQPVDPASPEVYALFRDPAGNVLGIYQERTLAGQD